MLKFCFYSWFAIALAVSSSLVATSAHAQNNDKVKAKSYLDRGDEILNKGDGYMSKDKVEKAIDNYEKALELYEKAYATYESPKIFFPIALTEQKLGRFKEALRHYQILLASDVELADDVKKQVMDGIELTKDNLVGFMPKVNPDGATVYMDGKKIGQTPLSKVFYVTPGWHEFKIRKTGYKTFEGDFDRKRGALEKRTVSLERGGNLAGDDKRDPLGSGDKQAKRPSRVPLWLGLGGTVALAGAATFTGLRALEEQENAEDPALTEMQRNEIKDDEFRLAVTTDVLIAGAAIAGAFTLYYYMAKVRPSSKKNQSKEKNVVFTPYLAPKSGGWMVRGEF